MEVVVTVVVKVTVVVDNLGLLSNQELIYVVSWAQPQTLGACTVTSVSSSSSDVCNRTRTSSSFGALFQ